MRSKLLVELLFLFSNSRFPFNCKHVVIIEVDVEDENLLENPKDKTNSGTSNSKAVAKIILNITEDLQFVFTKDTSYFFFVAYKGFSNNVCGKNLLFP